MHAYASIHVIHSSCLPLLHVRSVHLLVVPAMFRLPLLALLACSTLTHASQNLYYTLATSFPLTSTSVFRQIVLNDPTLADMLIDATQRVTLFVPTDAVRHTTACTDAADHNNTKAHTWARSDAMVSDYAYCDTHTSASCVCACIICTQAFLRANLSLTDPRLLSFILSYHLLNTTVHTSSIAGTTFVETLARDSMYVNLPGGKGQWLGVEKEAKGQIRYGTEARCVDDTGWMDGWMGCVGGVRMQCNNMYIGVMI